VKFWDTSAIVPLLVIEPGTGTAKSILTADSSVVVWWGTRTECVSALSRQIRDGTLRIEDERQARRVLQQLADAWSEVQPSELLRGTAERLLAVHALRAADALQLAAALHWCQRQPMNRDLVSSDTRIRDAAYKEGFTILPPHVH
jgi:predicted nucleic acid-binding protein